MWILGTSQEFFLNFDIHLIKVFEGTTHECIRQKRKNRLKPQLRLLEKGNPLEHSGKLSNAVFPKNAKLGT